MNLVIGNLNYDFVFEVGRMPLEHEKLSALSRTESCGGSAANTAYWLALLGLPIQMHGAVGDDHYGTICINSLEAVGIDCRGVQIKVGAQTRVQFVLISHDSKRMVGSGYAGDLFDASNLLNTGLAAGSICHFMGKDLEKLKLFITQARRWGATISCETNGVDCRTVLPYVDYAFMNEDELKRSITGTDPFAVVEDTAKLNSSHAVVTRGRNGAVLLGAQQQLFRNAFVVEPIDRTGGGDAFNAGFLYRLKKGGDYKSSLDLGLKLASAVISQKGPRPLVTLPR